MFKQLSVYMAVKKTRMAHTYLSLFTFSKQTHDDPHSDKLPENRSLQNLYFTILIKLN